MLSRLPLLRESEKYIMSNIKKLTAYEAKQKRLAQFTGSYIYYIKDKRTQQIIYVGQTDNFVRRYDAHFNEPSRESSSFNMFCIENGENKRNYEMQVLDLDKYDVIDLDDRLIIENAMMLYHLDTIVNKRKPHEMVGYEMERYEQLMSFIDFNFKAYTQLKTEKMSKKKA